MVFFSFFFFSFLFFSFLFFSFLFFSFLFFSFLFFLPYSSPLEDIARLQETLFNSVKIEGLMHGNITPLEAVDLMKKIEARFDDSMPLPLVCLSLPSGRNVISNVTK